LFLDVGFSTSSSANHGALVFMWGAAPEIGLNIKLMDHLMLNFETGWKFAKNHDNPWILHSIDVSDANFNSIYANVGLSFSFGFGRKYKK